jgi:hypothetical protein
VSKENIARKCVSVALLRSLQGAAIMKMAERNVFEGGPIDEDFLLRAQPQAGLYFFAVDEITKLAPHLPPAGSDPGQLAA